MKKFLLFTFFMLSALMGIQAQKVTLDFTTNDAWNLPASGGNVTQENSYTSGDYTIKLSASTKYYFHNDGYLMLGKNGSTLTLPAFDFNVSKIEVVGRTGASASTKENIYVGDVAVSEQCVGSTGTNTFEINSNYQKAGNIYVLKIESNHNAQITSIKIYEGGSASTLEAPTISGVTAGSVLTNAPTITITPPNSDNYTKSYYNLTRVDADGNSVLTKENVEFTTEAVEISASEFEGLYGEFTLETWAVYGEEESEKATITFSIIETCATIADFKTFVKNYTNVEACLTGDVTVTYQNGNNLYVQDETGALLIYGSTTNTYNNGDVLKGDKIGTAGVYGDLPQMAYPTSLPEATPGEEPAEPENMTSTITAEFDEANAHKYILLEKVSINLENETINVNGVDIAYYNTFKIDLPTDETAKYDLTGIYSSYKGTFQILPISFVAKTLLAPEITPSDGSTHIGSIEVTITTNMEAEIYYTTDGTEPSKENGTRYAEPFTVTATDDITVKAIAYDATTMTSVTSATYTYIDMSKYKKYKLVSSVDDIVVGRKYILVGCNESKSTYHAMTTASSTSTIYYQQVEISAPVSGVVTISPDLVDVNVLTLGGETGAWTFLTSQNNYLYWNSGNSLSNEETPSDNSKWTIEINEDGDATILNVATPQRRIFYNSSSPRFACYTSTQSKVYLYVEATEDVKTQLEIPSFSASAGRYTEAFDLYIDGNPDEDPTIMYSFDNEEWMEYTEKIRIEQTTTVYAYATKAGYIDSDLVIATYTFTSSNEVVGMLDFVTPFETYAAGWNQSYLEREVEFTDQNAKAVFSGASKQTGDTSITDCPVVKDGTITISFTDANSRFTYIDFQLKQWSDNVIAGKEPQVEYRETADSEWVQAGVKVTTTSREAATYSSADGVSYITHVEVAVLPYAKEVRLVLSNEDQAGLEVVNYLKGDITTGVDGIEVDENAPVEYYNFQGVRVANPEKGMYIRVQGGKATKVIVR